MGYQIHTLKNICLIDACHIIPFSESHNDSVTNGIALSPNLHRAFDRGLVSIDKNYRVIVSDKFVENESSFSIHQFEKQEIVLPEFARYYPSQENLEMHRERWGFY